MELCNLAEVGRSSYYYEGSTTPRGRKPSQSVLFKGEWVKNETIIPRIKELIAHECFTYGYLKVTKQLQADGYHINKKKVYRLMKADSLLKKQLIKSSGKRKFIQFRKPKVEKPLNYFEMDIKYIYIHEESRNAYLLSIIDVYSRKIVGHIFKRSIKKKDVIMLWEKVKPSIPDFKSITIRSDNGSQFIANDVRGYFYYQDIKHEFTNIATPEDDGHIEAFHSILEREFLSRNEYTSFEEMKCAIDRYMHCYNNERIHGSLKYKTPNKFIEEYNQKTFLEEGLNKKSALLYEASLLGDRTNVDNLNKITELCQTLS
jgi:putative transposase